MCAYMFTYNDDQFWYEGERERERGIVITLFTTGVFEKRVVFVFVIIFRAENVLFTTRFPPPPPPPTLGPPMPTTPAAAVSSLFLSDRRLSGPTFFVLSVHRHHRRHHLLPTYSPSNEVLSRRVLRVTTIRSRPFPTRVHRRTRYDHTVRSRRARFAAPITRTFSSSPGLRHVHARSPSRNEIRLR